MDRDSAQARRREAFCQEYVKDFNGCQAAIRAGYAEKGSRVTASRLLTDPNIQARVKELIAERNKNAGLNAERVIKELWALATVDVSEAFDEMGQLKPLSEIPEHVRRAISGIEVNELFDGQGDQKSVIGLAKKVKFWDKTKALDMFMKHFGKYAPDKVEHSGTLTLEQLLAGSHEEKKNG